MARARSSQAFGVEALGASLAKSGPAPVYVLSGAETFFRFEALKLVRGAVLPDDASGMGFLEFDDSADPRDVFDGLRTPGLFVEARMAVIDPADKFVGRNTAALARYVKSPATSACLALTVDRWQPKPELKEVSKGITVVACDRLRPKAVPAWVVERTRRHGKRLDRGVADLMIELAGADLSVLDRHLGNLVTYIGDRPSISAEDVVDLVGGDPQRATWELVAAVVKADIKAALGILELMLRQGVAPLRIINSLAFEFSRLWQVKRLMRDGASEDEMLSAIGRQYRFRLPHIRREAHEISPRRLLAAHRTLLESDLAAKTSAMPNDLLLECLVIRLCGTPGG